MQALLGLLWLSPDDLNWVDYTFGRFADQTKTVENQLWIAAGVGAFLVLALIWRQLTCDPKRLERVAPGVAKSLADERTLLWINRVVTAALVWIALVSSVNYFYGTRNNNVYLHRWDAFHTVLGAKYHSELGYFDLYKCAYAVDQAGPRQFRGVDKIRDLRTRKFVPAAQHIAGNDCKERFSPERLAAFEHDLEEFGTWSNPRNWRRLFLDKGFNGTPFYATVTKVMVSSVDVSLDSLRRLAYFDPLLMMIGFGFVGWAFGLRKAALVALVFTTFFPNRYMHMGGSILRYDYMAALLVGFSALKKDKWGLAGAVFAYATMVRVFPAIFAVGVGVKVLADVVVDRQIREEHWKFAAYFAGGLALFFIISLIGMDGGFDNWRTWAENMKVHNQKSAGYRIGFKHLFMLDGQLTAGNYTLKQQNFLAREDYYWVAVAVLMAPLLTSVRRLDTISFAALFGVFGFFLLTVATRYYYGLVAILLLVDRDELRNRYVMIIAAFLCFAASFDYFYYFELNDSSPLMYNTILGVELTVLVLLIASWLLFNPSLVELDVDPRVPAHVPARLGARALPVTPTIKKKKKKKKAKAKATTSKAKTDDASANHDEGGSSDDGSSDDEPALAKAVTRRDGPPEPDPDAVTVSDRGRLSADDDDDDRNDDDDDTH